MTISSRVFSSDYPVETIKSKLFSRVRDKDKYYVKQILGGGLRMLLLCFVMPQFLDPLLCSQLLSLYYIIKCVCVCLREREREGERECVGEKRFIACGK